MVQLFSLISVYSDFVILRLCTISGCSSKYNSYKNTFIENVELMNWFVNIMYLSDNVQGNEFFPPVYF